MEVATAPEATGASEPDEPTGTPDTGLGDPQEGAGEPTEGLTIQSFQQLSLAVGGKKPTTAALTLTGGKVDVEGSIDKGRAIVLRVEAVVQQVAFRDEIDKATGQTVGCARNHKARIVGVKLLEG
jgi:hypothetical protein